MNRKMTLAYGAVASRRVDRLTPRSTPPSSPPPGLRLVPPPAVPRPMLSSTPPLPASMRAPATTPVLAPPPAPVSVLGRLPPAARLPSFPSIDASLPPPPFSGPRSSPPPRPRTRPADDEVEMLSDEDLTVVVEPAAVQAPPPVALAPLPPVPWTADVTPVPANNAELAVPSSASSPAWSSPLDAALDDEDAPQLTPAAVLRVRCVNAWRSAPPAARTAITFGAGFLAGAMAIALV